MSLHTDVRTCLGMPIFTIILEYIVVVKQVYLSYYTVVFILIR